MQRAWRRWNQIADLVRLAAVSSRIPNIETPINVLLAGPPGDGKTRMIMRVEHLQHVEVLSDTTYLGLCHCLSSIKDGLIASIVVPDLGTLIGRRGDVARQTIATLSMMIAEGVRHIRVGKRVRDYGGARSSLISAITLDDLDSSFPVLSQNAFLSRVLLVDFDLDWTELLAMLERKHRGDRALLRPLSFRRAGMRRDGFLEPRPIHIAETYARRTRSWWTTLRRKRSDRFFGFRTADFLTGLLQSSAFIRGDNRVRMRDVEFVGDRILPLVMQQVRIRAQEGKG